MIDATSARSLRLGLATVRAGSALSVVGCAIAALNAVTVPRLRRTTRQRIGEPVAVLIPARNEADRIDDVIADVLSSTGLPQLRVVVYDDSSSDRTADLVSKWARRDARVELIRGGDLPDGWLGKSYACAALAAEHQHGVLVFADADVRLHPDALSASIANLRDSRVGLLAVWPQQVAESALEHLVQPLLAWSWAATLPVVLANKLNRPSLAVACGQLLIFDTPTYHEHGGHAAVASAITEDLEIARHLRRGGAHTRLVTGAGLVHCRMYRTPSALVEGYTRWLWSAYGSGAGSASVGLFLVLAYVVPPVAAILGRGRIRRLGAVGWTAAIGSRLAAHFSSSNRLSAVDAVYAIAHPAAISTYCWLSERSHRAHRSHTLTWKGRRLNPN